MADATQVIPQSVAMVSRKEAPPKTIEVQLDERTAELKSTRAALGDTVVVAQDLAGLVDRLRARIARLEALIRACVPQNEHDGGCSCCDCEAWRELGNKEAT